MTTRRDFLASIGATAVASAVPSAVHAATTAAVAIPTILPAPPMLAWAFDIKHGDYRDTCIAATAQEAHAEMINQWFDSDLADNCPRRVYGNTDECTSEDCNCQDCGMDEVKREPLLDTAAARGAITIADYHCAGWGYVCDRCGGEPGGGDWEPVDGLPVCDDCITIEEWGAINPEYAAELREDARVDAMTEAEYEAEFSAEPRS